jgi:hypothetical protein
MTVKDLMDVTPQIVVIDVTIRKNGRYVYRWKAGKHIQLGAGYTSEHPRNYELEDGERLDFPKNQLPATYWAIYPSEIGQDVKDLEITDMRLMPPFRSWIYNKETQKAIGWNALEAYITCDIGDRDYKKPRKEPNIVTDQMNIFDYGEVNADE